MDLENLNSTHSRIICSAPITRFSVTRKDIILNDNKEEFCILEHLKNRKDMQLNLNQQKYCSQTQPVFLKRKHRIKDTDGIIKRFKYNFAHKGNTEILVETDHMNSEIVSIPMSAPAETYISVKSPDFQPRKHTDRLIFQEKSANSTALEVDDYAASTSPDMPYSDEQFEKLFNFHCSFITPK